MESLDFIRLFCKKMLMDAGKDMYFAWINMHVYR